MIFGYQKYKALIDRFLKTLIENLGAQNLYGCALFGSIARGNARKESDIDLFLLISSRSPSIEDKIIKLLLDVEEWKEKKDLKKENLLANFTIIAKTIEELKANPLILLDIVDEGIVLYDPNGKLNEIFINFKKKLRELGAEKIIFKDGTWCWDLKPDWKPGEVVEITL